MAHTPTTYMPEGAIEDELGVNVALARKDAAPPAPPPLTESQRQRLLDIGRAESNGTLSVDTRVLVLLGMLIVAIVVMVIFYTNLGIARTLVREQTAAKLTAQMLAAELKQYLPPSAPATRTHTFVRAKPDGSPLEPPILRVTRKAEAGRGPPRHVALWHELNRLCARSTLPNGQRLSFWVIDIHGWVYADTKDPSRAFDTTTQAFPNGNLYRLNTVHNMQTEDKDNPTPSNVAAVILETATHGEGIATFAVPSLGTANTAVVDVTLFVQPIAQTDFVVAVQVGSKNSVARGL